jgi:hypothetical protein
VILLLNFSMCSSLSEVHCGVVIKLMNEVDRSTLVDLLLMRKYNCCCLLQDEVLDMAKKCMANGIQLLVIGKQHNLRYSTCTADSVTDCQLSVCSTVDCMLCCSSVDRQAPQLVQLLFGTCRALLQWCSCNCRQQT